MSEWYFPFFILNSFYFFCKMLSYIGFLYQIGDLLYFSWEDIWIFQVSFNDYVKRFFIFYSLTNNQIMRKNNVLLYGVSCGETKALVPLIPYVQNKHYHPFILTHTRSSYIIHSKSSHNTPTLLLPFDNLVTMFCFFLLLQPSFLIVCERDIKPCMLLCAKLFCTKIIYMNYCEKHGSKRQQFSNYFISAIADHILYKHGSIVKHRSIANHRSIGNLKWLHAPSMNHSKYEHLTFVIASANQNEFSIHYSFIRHFIKHLPHARFIYVPRYLDWEHTLREQIADLSYFWLTSKDQMDSHESIHCSQLTIVWCYGLLPYFLSKSHICLLGNTFKVEPTKGGHNLIEPAAASNAIITGPSYGTCKDLANDLKIIYTHDESDLLYKTDSLVQNKEYMAMGKSNLQHVLNKQINLKRNVHACFEDIFI